MAHLYTVASVCALPGALRPTDAMGRYSPQTPSEPQGTEHPRCGYSVPCGLIIPTRREVLFIAIYHCTIKIIKRSEGRSAVAAAAYRSGQKLTNEWDGQTHDYTRKGGVIHSEILLPAHALLALRLFPCPPLAGR